MKEEDEKPKFNKYVPIIFAYLVVAYVITNMYGILSYIGLWMIIATHELGHYLCAVIRNKNPKFIVSSISLGVLYHRKVGESGLLITSGGMILNFLFLPLFVGMGIMNAPPFWIGLMILGGSVSDISSIVRSLRGE